MLDRSVLVAEIFREVDGTLDHARRILRKVLLAVAALDAGQLPHGPVDLTAQPADVHAHTPQQKGSKRIILADQHREHVERFDSLLSALPGKSKCRLQRLLRLDG